MRKYAAKEVRRLNHFYRDIYYRLHNRDQNFLMVITGNPGTGKSYAALRMATQIDPNFVENMDKNIVFDPHKFMDRVNDPDLYDGACIIWEEIGTGISSKEWYSVINKQIGYVIQTFRKKHICLIMTVPNTDFMDATVRKLVNAIGRMMSIDRTQKVSRMRVWYVNYESNTKKWYFKKPIITLHDTGQTIKVSSIKMPKVERTISRSYDSMRQKFVDRMGLQVKAEIDVASSKTKTKKNAQQIASEVIEKRARFLSPKTGELDVVQIQYHYSIPRQKAYDVKRLVEALTMKGEL